MQTFLPYRDFTRSAAVLDLRRLGKQRVETLQILRAITFEDYGWRNHPAVVMWVGFTEALVTYGAAVTRRWREEGFSDRVLTQLLEFLGTAPLRTQRELAAAGALPPWLGQRRLHRSHQAALLRKDPEHYGPLFPRVDPDAPYMWPVVAPVGAPPVVPEPVSAWVIRARPDDLVVMLDQGFAGLRPLPGEDAAAPAGAGARNTKRRRQLTALIEDITPGDRVVVPDGGLLHVGDVAGDYEWRGADRHGLHHRRPVTWRGAVERAALRRPVFLQDPRLVFPLRGEPVVAA